MISFTQALKSGLIAASIALAPMVTTAQTLREALAHAAETSPTLQSGQAQALQSISTYNDAVARTKLQVSGSFSVSGTENNQINAFNPNGDFQSSENAQVTLNFTQALFQGSFDGIPAGVRQTLGGVSVAHSNYKSQEMSALSLIINAYMSVLREEAALGVAHSGVHAAEDEADAARARLAAGEGTRTQVALANATVAQAQANMAFTRSTYDSAVALYRQVVGQEPGVLQDPGFPAMPGSLQSAIDLGLTRHPSITSAQLNVQIAQDGVVTTAAQNGLAISAFGSAQSSVSELSWDADSTETFTIGIQGSIPIVTGGSRRAAIESAELNLQAAQANYQAQAEAIRSNIRQAWANVQAQMSSLNSFIAVASAQEVVLRATEAEYEAGAATLLQVINARQSFAEAQNQYVRTKASAVLAAYTLIEATGGLTTEALDLPVAHFDTFAELNANRNLTYAQMFGL